MNPGWYKLALIITRLLKGTRNKGNAPILVILERDPTDFSFCVILYFLGLIFRDMPFLSPHIRTPMDLWRMHIPAHRECLPVEWHSDWLNTPILRRTTRSGENGQVVVSRSAALQNSQVRKWGRRLGREFGLERDFEPKMLRRGAAQRLSKTVAPGLRSQIMGHARDDIYDRHYQNQVVDVEVAAAFLDKPSDVHLLEAVNHMSFTRDHHAPTSLTATERRKLHQEDEQVFEAQKSCAEIRTLFEARYGDARTARRRLGSHDTTKREELEELLKVYKAAQEKVRSTVAAAERRQIDANRQHFFATVGAKTLENYHNGVPEPKGLQPLKFESRERAKLAELLFPNTGVSFCTHAEAIFHKCELVTAVTQLCQQRIPAPAKRLEHCADSSISAKPAPDPEHEAEVPPPPDSPLNAKIPGLQCLFCLAQQSLIGRTRTYNYSTTFTLTRHVYNQHFKFMDTTKQFPCPHPACQRSHFLCDNLEHFMAHAWRDHNVYYCRQLD
ncbi:hypothetical protein MMC13_006944 [Lambiella insularis]|nr:hypothetical protein [Lambiella insularis]